MLVYFGVKNAITIHNRHTTFLLRPLYLYLSLRINMSNSLDTSLDDIIRHSRRPYNTYRPATARFPGPGPIRRFNNNFRGGAPTPYQFKPAREEGRSRSRSGAVSRGDGEDRREQGTRLYVSNLDFGVSNDDIRELFSEVGDLKKYSINYDRSGRSKGTAEIFFLRQEDAIAAVKKYNNVELDGKPMKIEMVTPVVMHPNVDNNVRRGRMNFVPRNEYRGGFGGGGRPRGVYAGFGGRGFGPGRGRGKGRRDEDIKIEDLDADLEKYRNESMETS